MSGSAPDKPARRVKKVVADDKAPSGPKLSDRAKLMAKTVREIDGFELWGSVKPPKILKTRITSFNRGSKCGGIPGGMLGVLHGPSQGGKSLLLAEIMHATWESGGWGVFVDAECRAVDLEWYNLVCGNLDEIAYYKPPTFESLVVRVQKFREKFRAAKDAGEIPDDGFCTIGIDSINRLTPASELKLLMDKGEATGKDGRKYPLRALMTTAWLDSIVPTLQRDESLVFISRESTKIDAQPGQKQYRVKGGVSQVYDGGWICRVTSASKVRIEGKKDKILLGEKHELDFLKNSMGPHLDEVGYFYSAVGRNGEPKGFDFLRELREEAIFRDVIRYESGRGYFLDGDRIAAKKDDLVPWLRDNLKLSSTEERPCHEVIRERLDAEFAGKV